MPFSLKRLGTAGLASLLLFVASGAFAQAKKPANPPPAAPTQPQPPPPPRAKRHPPPAPPARGSAARAPPQGRVKIDLVPTQNDWTKVCGRDQAANKDICYTTRDFSAKAGEAPVLALAIYDIKGDETRIIRLLVPVGLMLRPGFRFWIDSDVKAELAG